MKQSKQCPKCRSLRVGYLERVLEQVGAMPRDAVVGISRYEGWLGGGDPVGSFEAFLCADCGYFETYIKQPSAVDFDRLQGFHWLNGELAEQGPYR